MENNTALINLHKVKLLFVLYVNRFKPKYSKMGFLLRFGFDLIIALAGMFIGYLFTGLFYYLTNANYGLDEIVGLISDNYFIFAPWFLLSCVLAFLISGLYRVKSDAALVSLVFSVGRAVGTAFLFFIFGMYFLERSGSGLMFILPRSSVLSGWMIVFVLMISIRILRTIFQRKFMLITRTENNQISFIANRLRATENEMGWVSKERVEASQDQTIPISNRFAMWPNFEESTINKVASVLRSGKVNMWTGEQNDLFCAEYADFCDCTHAISVVNGTVALELALRALNIGPGDEVIVPCRTFIASASSVVMVGAKPIMADIDRDSQNLNAATIEKGISDRTKAIIAVHLNGWPCDMDPIMKLANERGIKVIEDCAQAHGAMYKGRSVGSLGDIAAFSFCQDKIITTGGEGGMVTINEEAVWQRAWSLKDHGKSQKKMQISSSKPGFKWIHEDFGTNWRMTEMQAVIGRGALRKLPEWVKIRRRYAKMLTGAFLKIPGLRVTVPEDYFYHAYYKYYVFIEPEQLSDGWNRDRIMNAINDEGIPCFSGICGQIFREEAFRKHGFLPKQALPISEELMNTSLMFLVHPTLLNKNIENTIDAVRKVMGNAV